MTRHKLRPGALFFGVFFLVLGAGYVLSSGPLLWSLAAVAAGTLGAVALIVRLAATR